MFQFKLWGQVKKHLGKILFSVKFCWETSHLRSSYYQRKWAFVSSLKSWSLFFAQGDFADQWDLVCMYFPAWRNRTLMSFPPVKSFVVDLYFLAKDTWFYVYTRTGLAYCCFPDFDSFGPFSYHYSNFTVFCCCCPRHPWN